MDYLPTPHRPVRPVLEVPCISTEDYDGDLLESYPDRKGWGPRSLEEWQIIFQKPQKTFQSFLQTWLFFGPLKLMLGDQALLSKCTDTITRSSGESQRIIKIAHLLDTLRQWINSGHQKVILSGTNEERNALVSKYLGTPIYVNSLLCKDPQFFQKGMTLTSRISLQDFLYVAKFNDPRDPAIATSTALLIETLLGALIDYNRGANGMDLRRYLGALNGTSFHLLEHTGNVYTRMESDGWCPAQLSMMFKRLNGAAIYFMSLVEPPNSANMPSNDNSTKASAIGSPKEVIRPHDVCNKFQCVANQLNKLDYRTKHTSDCHGCYELFADYDEVYNILQSDCIPLISSFDEQYEGRRIKLVGSQPDLNYVAISHVWSDGLGNVKQSALPRCQLLRLSNLIRNLPGKPSHFWIDTIGCPPGSAGQMKAQKLAIAMMRQTYVNACAVLVLDSWLERQVTSDMSHAEILIRIVCCGWNSRLWTFQEGALAKRLFFQFDDTQYDLDEGLIQLRQSKDLSLEPLKFPIVQRVFEIRMFRQQEHKMSWMISGLISALAFRLTSVASDEALCLGTLLDVDVLKIVETRPEDRMATFWSLLAEVPSGFLFSRFPRIDRKGYRWAPKSLLRDKESGGNMAGMLFGGSEIATPTQDGLLAHFSGFIFPTGRFPIGINFHAKDKHDNWYLIDCDASNALGAAPYELALPGLSPLHLWSFDPGELHDSEWLAFVSSSSDRMDHLGPQTPGLLASVNSINNDITYVSILCRAKYSYIDPTRDGLTFNPPEWLHEKETVFPRANAHDGRLGFTVWEEVECQWCLG